MHDQTPQDGAAREQTLDAAVAQAVAAVRRHTSRQPSIAVVLGSGLGGLVEEFREPVTLPYSEIPNFPVSAVEGHQGALVWGRLAGREVVAMAGRVHYYEGYTMAQVTFPVRVLAGLGIRRLIITNAAGAVRENLRPGEVVLISDHINLMGDNPLRGTHDFIDLTRAYDPGLRETARKVAARLDIPLNSGVYLAMSGPCYETPAEIGAIRSLGADLVGMSTVPEAIMANRLGLEVLGLSMVTNMAAGITGQPLSHQEVMETSEQGKTRFKQLVKEILAQMES